MWCGQVPLMDISSSAANQCRNENDSVRDVMRGFVTDTQRTLDEAPLSRTQIIAIALTALMGAVDGYDVLAMAYAAPGITEEWQINKATLGIALSSGLAGMAFGSLTLTPLADEFGRRKMILAVLAVMGLGILLTAFSRSVTELSLLRVFTGVGMGALIPIIAPLAIEYSNVHRRRLALAIMTIGFPLGATLGGFAAAALLQYHGWHSVFLLGAAATLGLLVAAYFWLPESPAFLIARRGPRALELYNDYLRRCGHEPALQLPAPNAEGPKHSSYVTIFAHRQWTVTITLAAIDMLYLMTVYYVLSWTPQLIVDLGHTSAFATMAVSLGAMVGVLASLAIGLIGINVPLRWITAGLMTGLSITTAAFGIGGFSTMGLVLLVAVTGTFLYGGTTAINGLIVNSFTVDSRATGAGFVMGVGRLAGVISPALAGFLFTAGLQRPSVSVMISLCTLMAASLVLFSRQLRSVQGDLERS
ncbi:hypothetical protein C1T17_02835 [Sphingobium sp. SCG-1]|nr:hypothetical protein C1T17_02835 [Sphingobium sp. SCG-1]